jgi:hypothetical protein
MASLAAADPNAVRRASLDRRMSSGIAPAQLAAGADAEKAALPVPTWEPDADYDAKLMELLARPTQPERSSGRQTMGRLGIPRILEAVPLEAVPESLRSLLEETEDADKDEVDPSMPGSRKRRFQELADTVDRDLIIEHDVETVSST